MPLYRSLTQNGELTPLKWDLWQTDALNAFIRQEDGFDPDADFESDGYETSPGQDQLHTQGYYHFRQYHTALNPHNPRAKKLQVRPGDEYQLLWKAYHEEDQRG